MVSVNDDRHKCEIRFEARHTFEKVVSVLRSNQIIPKSISNSEIVVTTSNGTPLKLEDPVTLSLIENSTERAYINVHIPLSPNLRSSRKSSNIS